MKSFYRFLGSKYFILPVVLTPFAYLVWVFVSNSNQIEVSDTEASVDTTIAENVVSDPTESTVDDLGFDPSLFVVSEEEHQAATQQVEENAVPEPVVTHLHEKLTDETGDIAVAFFILVLCLTPLKVVFRRSKFVSALNRHRRIVGLACFFYATLHLSIYLTNGLQTLLDELTRFYIAAGLSAFAILLVLAATSSNFAQRSMGGRKWKKLHRIIYLAIPMILYHKGWAGKADWNSIREAFVWFSPLFLVQIVRISKQIKKRSVPKSAPKG